MLFEMKNFFNQLFLIGLFAAFFIGCSDDDKEIYIVNSTYSIEVGPDGETKTFGFRTNGHWSITTDADWLVFDKTSGDPLDKEYQYVEVTVERYGGNEKRKAVISIDSDGKENTIDVVQSGRIAKPTLEILDLSHGLVVIGWDLVDGWRDLTVRKFLIELMDAENGKVLRSYSPFITQKKYCYNRFVFGKLEAATKYVCQVTLLAEGESTGESDVASIEFTTNPKPVLDASVLLYMDFDNFWFGGNGIWGAFGVAPTNDQFKLFALSTEFTDPVETTTNTVKNVLDGFSSSATKDYKMDRWGENYKDWEKGGSTAVYETAGFVKFGTGSKNGVLATPLLAALTEATDIQVSFKACPYSEPNANGNMTIDPAVEEGLTFKVSIIGAGEFEGGKTSLNLKNKSNVNDNPDTDRLEWTQHDLLVKGADATTRIKIETLKSAGNYRMWLDDLIIKK